VQTVLQLIVDATKAVNPLDQADRAAKKLKATFKGVQSVTGQVGSAFGQAGAAASQAARKVSQFGDESQKASKQAKQLAEAVRGIGAGFAIGATVQAINSLATSYTQFQRLGSAINVTVGSANAFQAALSSVYKVQALTGESTTELSRRLTGLLVAAKGTAFEGAKAAQTFEQLQMLTVAFGGNAYQAEKAVYALQQMMSKGKVSAEELRGQLGDALPGALELFRQAYKGGSVSAAEFNKLIDDGKLTINDFIGINDVLKAKLDALYGTGFGDYLTKQAEFNQQLDRLKLIGGALAAVIGSKVLPKVTELIKKVAAAPPDLIAFAAAFTSIAAAIIAAVAALAVFNTALAASGIAAGAKKLGGLFAAGMAGPPIVKGFTLAAAAAVGAGGIMGINKLKDDFEGAVKDMQKMLANVGKFQLPDGGGDPRTLNNLKDQTKERRKSFREIVGAQNADIVRSVIQARLNDNQQQINDAIKSGNSELQRRLETERKFIDIDGRREALITLINLGGAKQNKLSKTSVEYATLAKGITESQGELELLNQERKGIALGLSQDQLLVEQSINELIKERLDLSGATFTDDPIRSLTDQTIPDAIKSLNEELTKLLNPSFQIVEAVSSIGDAFSNSFKEIINGTSSAQEALAGFFRSIANNFLDMAAEIITAAIKMQSLQIIQSLFPQLSGFRFGVGGAPPAGLGGAGGLFVPGILPGIGGPGSAALVGARAGGGSVMAGQGYLVGERGPELFMPGRSGGIAPTGSFGGAGNIVVNVDANGSNVQGDGAQANALGKAIGIAVQQELIKQKRPGGLLA
jgi:tape measure domain-containing protein